MQFHSHFLPGVHLGSSPALQKSNSAKHTQSVSLVFVNDWPGQHDCEACVGGGGRVSVRVARGADQQQDALWPLHVFRIVSENPQTSLRLL